MRSEDWRDITWETVDIARWTFTAQLNWTAIGPGDWQTLRAEHWGYPAKSNLQPLFSAVSLESLGFSQDDDYIYLPLSSIISTGISWTSLTATQWLNLTVSQWTGIGTSTTNTLTAQQLFYLLLAKLQSSALPAHQVRNNGDYLVVESKALADSSFDPDNY